MIFTFAFLQLFIYADIGVSEVQSLSFTCSLFRS